MEISPCLYLRLQRPDSAWYFGQMHLRKQTRVLPITATVPRGPSHITSHACRPDLVDQRWVIKRANNMLPEAYFSPSAICTLGYWVPKKCGKWNIALKWTWWRSPMQSESIGFHIDVPWAICWIPCVVKCPQFRLNIILIDLLLNQLFCVVKLAPMCCGPNLICGGGWEQLGLERLLCQFSDAVHPPHIIVLVI